MVKWLLIVLAVVLALAVVTLMFGGGGVIKQGVNTLGPRVLGVPVTLDGALFYPFRGHVSLRGLTVGNPDGFNTESLFDARTVDVDVKLRSLFTDTIVIKRIFIDHPQITYEAGLRGTNLGALLAWLEKGSSADEELEAGAATDEAVAKTVVVETLILADARAQVSAPTMRGRVVPVQLSTITLTDLGGEGQSLTQIVTLFVKAVLGAVNNAVSGAGDLLGDGLESALQGAGALGGMATDGTKAVSGAVSDGVRSVGGVLRRDRQEDVSVLEDVKED